MNGDEREDIQILETVGTLKDFVPDDNERHSLLYFIAHVFLPSYVFQNPFAFFVWDELLKETSSSIGVDPSRFIQARVSAYVLDQKDADQNGMVFRRMSDLCAEWVEGIGEKAMLIEMPVPEKSPHAFFCLAVSLIPIHELPKHPPSGNAVRFFTLERTVEEGRLCGLDEPAVFGEWTGRQHRNFGIVIPPIAADFLACAKYIISETR